MVGWVAQVEKARASLRRQGRGRKVQAEKAQASLRRQGQGRKVVPGRGWRGPQGQAREPGWGLRAGLEWGLRAGLERGPRAGERPDQR